MIFEWCDSRPTFTAPPLMCASRMWHTSGRNGTATAICSGLPVGIWRWYGRCLYAFDLQPWFPQRFGHPASFCREPVILAARLLADL